MRKRKNTKKLYTSILAVTLAVAVLLTTMPFSNIKAEPNNPTTQTGYSDVLASQIERWNNILTDTFGNTVSKISLSNSYAGFIPSKTQVENNIVRIQDNNKYFNWKVLNGITPWDGTGKAVTAKQEVIRYDSEDIVGGDGRIYSAPETTVTYTVYDVETAEELKYAMDQSVTGNVKINLLKDIDLNGKEKLWEKIVLTSGWLDIEGNGHTIYNLKCHSGSTDCTGFIGEVKEGKKLIIKNLDFSNCLVFSHSQWGLTSVVVGFIHQDVYFENINVTDSFVYSSGPQTGTLIGRTEGTEGSVFIRNCSSSGCYVFGTEHSGGLTGCQHNKNESVNGYKVKYDAAFPKSPEAWMSWGETVYSEIVEDCYSIDCELYSIDNVGDSGGLLSCGGKLICRNCFTNNHVYGNTKTGAFFGRVVTPDAGANGLYDDAGQQKVAIYFENCYASGSIEGTQKIGGFVGFEDSEFDNQGVAVYKNCYTTAMVGMDYAGSQLGGFIGHENTRSGQRAAIKLEDGSVTTNPGAVYINCYAAGEVGNILTDTHTTASGNALGGFLGEAGNYGRGGNQWFTSGKNNGNYINCYYDMQTTAMRERACGVSGQFAGREASASQIPGVTGVYTLRSDKKDVSGLAEDVRFNNDAWTYNITYYPQLGCFIDDNAVNNSFATVRADTDNEETINRIKTQLKDKAETVKKYSQASTATVLLSHWDSVMNMDTGTLGDENNWKPGVPANQMVKDTDGWWKLTYTKLAAGEYEFKIQEGTSWAYNFGKDKFNGGNCVLNLNEDDCDVTIRFKYDGRVSDTWSNTNFNICADIYKDGVLIETQELGKNEYDVSQSIWTVVGSFGTIEPEADWKLDKNYTDFDMSYIGDSQYVLTKQIPAGTYSFKIAKDKSWSENYGLSGKADGNNMTFTVSENCDVRFCFDEETHLTTVMANPSSLLTFVQTEEQPINFTGFSVIASEAITGHSWLDGEQAARDGEMILENGKYIKTFTVKSTDSQGNSNFDKIYGYKVIKDALDVGQNSYFRLLPPPQGTDEIEVTFTYDPVTNQTDITGNIDGCVIENPQPAFYGVLGVEELTGHNWEEAADGSTASQTGAMSYSRENNQWTKTYYNIPAGTYAFKVVGEGTFSSGIDFGANDGSGNYIFTTNKESNITIAFDTASNMISVSTSPEDSLEIERYVVSGTESLTGANWNTTGTENIMDYNEYTGVYSKTYEHLGTSVNYVFKVVKFGMDNNSENNCFCIKDDPDHEDEEYKLVVEYSPKTKKTEFHLYDINGVCVDEYMVEPEVDHYSVIGDQDLTKFNWLGENNVDQAAADNAGRMEKNEEGIWTKTFVDVPISSVVKNVGFKIVANGTWDSGISYGGAGNSNYLISLSSQSYIKCNVTIAFDENTHEISVSTIPEGCDSLINEDEFDWYVTGTYQLVSSDAYIAPKTVYDTVRDITAEFKFTSDKNLGWIVNNDKNAESGFFNHLGADDANSGFNLEYTVDGKKITGTFNEPIVTVDKSMADNGQYTQYSCVNFMPGKQWLSVSAGETDGICGRRDLRLIPTAYLEAGNEADIYVLQAGSDTKAEDVKNVVRYRKNALSDITFSGLSGENFSYYNLALTAGYAITDRTGLGFYGNYSKQKVQTYSDSKLRKEDTRDANTYYAMSSVFCENAEYNDAGNYIFSKNNGSIEKGTTNLAVDTLQRQSLIGNSYYDKDQDEEGKEKNAAKTLVKIYKKVEDANGTLEADGKRYSYPKVFMDSNINSASEYHTNYLKWTGQQAFDVSDEGTYFVTYFWSLADGRYLTDSKKVYIKSNLSEINKSTNRTYIEKSGDTNEIQYTITYTNRVQGDFTIYDVLPYDNDVRYDESKKELKNSSVVNSANNFKITDVHVECDSESVQINKFWYTDDSVQMNSDGTKAENLENINWNEVNDSGNDYNVNRPATAFKLSGMQSAEGTSNIKITFTVTVNDAAFKDFYINNTFFSVKDTASQNVVEGYSNPVKTAVVGRGLSGYAWLDSNINGKFDSTEPPVQGIQVTLMRKNGDVYEPVNISTTTDANGYYEFPDIAFDADEYKVQFEAPADGKVKVMYSSVGGRDEDIKYADLHLSRTLSEYQVDDKNQSRNIAREDGDKKYYINETMPGAEDILMHNNRDSYLKGSIYDYYFSKEYQNLGLVDTELKYSITIKKVNEDNESLDDVIFRLEYLRDGEWLPVTGDEIENGEFITDETGMIVVDNLFKAKYRITEIKTKPGYNLLPGSIEVELPYAIAKEGSESSTLITTNSKEPDSQDENYKYYNDVTFNIINTKNINNHLPLTGSNGYFNVVFIGAIIAVMGIGIILFALKQKKKY